MKYITIISIMFQIAYLVSCKKTDDINDGTLKVSLADNVSTLDPANAYDTISASIVYQCYEQLYEYHYLKRPYTIRPLLAEGLPKVDEDGLIYTIKIKKNIRYHNDPAFKGKPRYLKAQDFITQIKRLAYIPTKSNGWWLFDGKIKGINEWRSKVQSDFKKFKNLKIEGLKALDDQTLRIELNIPYPQMLYSLTMSFTSPIPIEAVEYYKNLLNERIVGTGPFKLQKWTKFSKIKIVKNENYREAYYPSQGDRIANNEGLLKDANQRIPFLSAIEFKILREAQPRWLNFRSKKIDLIAIPKDNFSSAIGEDGTLKASLAKDGIKLFVFPTLTYWWLSFNMQDPLWGKNKHLRLAIAHAVNTQKYIKVFTNNIALKANSIYPPGIPGYHPSSNPPYFYSIKKAKEHLKMAGYPNGQGLPVLRFDTRGTGPTNRQKAEFIAAELKKIGIKIKITTNTFPAFLNKAKNGKLQFWQDGWAMDYPDAENSLQLLVTKNHSPGPNATFYSNKKFDQYFNQLKILSNGKEKRELMKKMENIIFDDLPWIMQFYSRNYILHHSHLKNYRPSDLVFNNYKYLKISR